jgi:hypothetical protein
VPVAKPKPVLGEEPAYLPIAQPVPVLLEIATSVRFEEQRPFLFEKEPLLLEENPIKESTLVHVESRASVPEERPAVFSEHVNGLSGELLPDEELEPAKTCPMKKIALIGGGVLLVIIIIIVIAVAVRKRH